MEIEEWEKERILAKCRFEDMLKGLQDMQKHSILTFWEKDDNEVTMAYVSDTLKLWDKRSIESKYTNTGA